RLLRVPFDLDLPYWVDDPDFDIDFHVRHHAVPPPRSDERRAETVSRIVARPLDRRRPLWELYVIEGLEGGRIAQLTKIHHATIDGASAASLLSVILATDPERRPRGVRCCCPGCCAAPRTRGRPATWRRGTPSPCPATPSCCRSR